MNELIINMVLLREGGGTDQYHECYQVEPREGGGFKFRQRRDGKTETGFAYIAGSEAEFKAEREVIIIKEHAEREKFRAFRRDADARLAVFDAEIKPRLETILNGLSERDEIVSIARVAEEQQHFSSGGMLQGIIEMPVAEARKLLRDSYKAARANVREEYPEEYREADDKDDFYDEHSDDIATAFGSEL